MIIENGAHIDPSCTVINSDKLILRKGAYVAPECYIDATGSVEIGEEVRMSFRGVILSNTHHIARDVFRRSVPGDRHRPVIIERGCWIGAHVTIYPGVVIREGCVINAGSVIMRNTDPNGLYAPPEARRVKDLSNNGILPSGDAFHIRNGTSYENRKGEYITIIQDVDAADPIHTEGYRFIDDRGRAYLANGWTGHIPTVFDLVKKLRS